MKFNIWGAVSLLAGMWTGGAAHAQGVSEVQQAAQAAQRLQQIQSQQWQEQWQQDRSSAAPPSQIVVPEVTTRPHTSGLCRDIQSIAIQDSHLLREAELRSLVSPYEMRCLGVSEIEALLADITRAYLERGWIGSRAYLPAQDLSQGQLRVLVVEGKLSKLLVEDDGQDSISLATVAPGLIGRPLNIRDLEQALDQINRLASNQATLEMLPGEAAGESIVVLRNRASSPLHAHASFDNQGSESTGREQASLTLSLDNVLGLNDFLSYNKRRTFPLWRGVRLSESDSLSYILPWGYSTLSLNGTHARYASIFQTQSGSDLKNSGISRSYAFRMDRVMYRDAKTRWNLYGNLTAKSSESYLEDVLLSAASRKLSVLDLGANVQTVWLGSAWSVDLGYSQGTKYFGALRDSALLQREDPHAQFSKWTLNLTVQRPFEIGSQRLDFSSQWSGQYANHVLYGSEQIMIGSLYSVRGFSSNSLSGDHGLHVRNELGLRKNWQIAGLAGSIRPWIGLDYGFVRSRNAGVPEGALTGMAMGLQMAMPYGMHLDIQGTKPLSKPRALHFDPSQIFLRLSINL